MMETLCEDGFLHFPMFGSTKKKRVNRKLYLVNGKLKTFFRGCFPLKFYLKQFYLTSCETNG